MSIRQSSRISTRISRVEEKVEERDVKENLGGFVSQTYD